MRKDGIIPEGYKLTDVGVIPSDWEVKQLGNIAPLQRGFDLPTSQLKKGSYPVVYSNGILNYHFEYKAKAPGIITGRSGTIGKVTYIDKDYWPHNTSLWVTDFRNNWPLFIYYLYINVRLERFGTGSGVPTLNRNDVHAFKIPLPPLPEQKRIAKALTNVDELITAIDKLITKKRNIKQGAMQQLLTEKTRLPRFTGDWEVKRLGDIVNIDIDNLKSSTDPNYTFNYISLEDVDRGILKNVSTYMFSSAPSRARRNIIKHDILISTVRPNLKSHLLIKNDVKNLVCSTGFSVIRCAYNKAKPEFIYYHFFSSIIENQIINLLVGSNYPAVKSKDIKNLLIPVPSFSEQEAIAEILTNIDEEIEALEKKRDKYKAIKHGMMSVLLTGKKRLYQDFED